MPSSSGFTGATMRADGLHRSPRPGFGRSCRAWPWHFCSRRRRAPGGARGRFLGRRAGDGAGLGDPAEGRVGGDRLPNAGSVFRVDRVRGDWLWVDSGNIRGWVKKDAVVPFDQAIVHFAGVIAREPGNAYALVCRGMARHARRDYEGAIADATAALASRRRTPGPITTVPPPTTNEFDKALADADQAIKLDPDEPAHHANRASILVASKAYERAIADYSEAIARLKGLEAYLDELGR